MLEKSSKNILDEIRTTHIRIEKALQTNASKISISTCSECTKVCCKENICRESIDSDFLRFILGSEISGYDTKDGWFDSRSGCRLKFGRPLICYEYFCSLFSSDYKTQNIQKLSKEFRAIYERVLNRKHILEIDDIYKIPLSKLVVILQKLAVLEGKIKVYSEKKASKSNRLWVDVEGEEREKANLISSNLSGAIGLPEWVKEGLGIDGVYSLKILVESIRTGFKNLNEANLSRANLSRANLSGTNLSFANLIGANLSDANLSDANLNFANVIGANLIGANLGEANLSDANLSDANLSNANLSWNNLSYTNLTGADLSRANLTGADLSGANLSHANLSDANLRHANLSRAIGLPEWVKEGLDKAGK